MCRPASAVQTGTIEDVRAARTPPGDAAVERALTLGATLADIDQTGDVSWVVLRDPRGNGALSISTDLAVTAVACWFGLAPRVV